MCAIHSTCRSPACYVLCQNTRGKVTQSSHLSTFGLIFKSPVTTLGYKREMEIGRLGGGGYFSPVFGAENSEKSGNSAEAMMCSSHNDVTWVRHPDCRVSQANNNNNNNLTDAGTNETSWQARVAWVSCRNVGNTRHNMVSYTHHTVAYVIQGSHSFTDQKIQRGPGLHPENLKFGATWDIKIHYRNALMRNFQGYFSRTFHDFKLQFPGFIRTKVIFQDFPGPGILIKKNPGLSRRLGNPGYTTIADTNYRQRLSHNVICTWTCNCCWNLSWNTVWHATPETAIRVCKPPPVRHLKFQSHDHSIRYMPFKVS